ncbi:MAG: hypothetical protein ACM3UT_02065 [Chloroflexota bacterium]
MAVSEEKIKKLASLLEKDNPSLIVQAVERLREEEPFEGAVALLASCYDRNHDVMVNRAIETFFNDLKDKSARSEVVGELKKEHKPHTVTMLASSCWQSGLDYSAFSIDFTEIFLKSDYGTALECMTVIEESIPVLTEKEKSRIKGMVGRSAEDETSPKKALAIDLMEKLES